MPQVSVIMPVYNMADSPALYAAVNSIKRQTYQDWELLLCDDGSEDHTIQTIRQAAGGEKRIRIFYSSKNHKAGWVRNACIRASRGNYIALMDADDISDPRRLELQVGFLKKHPEYAFVGSNAWMIDAHGVWGMRVMKQRPGKEDFLSTLPFVHPSIVMRREAVCALHGYMQTPFAYRVEDYDLLMRMYANGCQGYNIQQPLLYYREEAGSYQKRKYQYRITECRVRYIRFRELGILRGHWRYVIKPLAVGLIPPFIMRLMRARLFRVKSAYRAGPA